MNDFELLMEYNKILQLEVEKLNHYKTLYNVLKDRNDKAIEYIDKHKENEYRNGRNDEIYLELNEKELKEFLKILKGESNE